MPEKPITIADIDKTVSIVDLCSGTTEMGREFYAYISIPPSKYQDYRARQSRHEKINLDEFGDIIFSDWGKEPPADVRLHMEREYHLVHDLESRMQHALETQLAEKK